MHYYEIRKAFAKAKRRFVNAVLLSSPPEAHEVS